jgi:hypothetical protein
VANIIDYTQLLPYVAESGFKYRGDVAQTWFKLAQQLSGNDLSLFRVDMVGQSLNSGLAMI